MYRFFIFILMCRCSYIQKIEIGEYVIDINSKQVDCELRIASDFTYEICLDFHETDDIVYSALLSYGHYSTNNEQLILHDDYYDFDWDILIRSNAIGVGRGYAFLDGKRILEYHSENAEVSTPDKNYLSRNKVLIDNFIAQQNNAQLVVGQYKDQNHRYTIILEDGGRYLMYLKDVLLLEGIWRQQDNNVVLHDDRLNHDFTMAIGNEKLLSLGIPGEFGGTMFTLIKTKTNKSQHETKTSPKNRHGGCSRIK